MLAITCGAKKLASRRLATAVIASPIGRGNPVARQPCEAIPLSGLLHYARNNGRGEEAGDSSGEAVIASRIAAWRGSLARPSLCLDCFATLAMTGEVRRLASRPAKPSLRRAVPPAKAGGMEGETDMRTKTSTRIAAWRGSLARLSLCLDCFTTLAMTGGAKRLASRPAKPSLRGRYARSNPVARQPVCGLAMTRESLIR
jgi:hypothetical protein